MKTQQAPARPQSFVVLALLVAASLPTTATAGFIRAVPDGAHTKTFDTGVGTTGCSTGAQTVVDAGFSISSDGASCMPLSAGWSFGDNGTWYNLSLIGDASGYSTLTINLGGLYSSVGGFMNYALFFDPETFTVSTAGADPMIAALDIHGQVMESYDILGALDFSFGESNNGDFVGIADAGADIAYFQISGDNLAMHNISLGTPEPAAWLLCGVGLLVAARRRPTSTAFKQ